MEVAGASRQPPHDAQPGTLGGILYADTPAPVSEQDWVGLVRAIAAGNHGAFHALYERSHRVVFTVILRITNNRETAEELTLDVFYDVWRRASAYDVAGGSVMGWILNQARSRAIDRLRFDQRKKRVSQEPNGAPPSAAAVGPQDTFDLREQARIVRGALAVLGPQERLAIETAFFSELTYGEVAARLGQPLGTVKTRIRSGLLKLRHALLDDPKTP
jgi:RNA polymerase sigma-70 factor (ECF subfamily)